MKTFSLQNFVVLVGQKNKHKNWQISRQCCGIWVNFIMSVINFWINSDSEMSLFNYYLVKGLTRIENLWSSFCVWFCWFIEGVFINKDKTPAIWRVVEKNYVFQATWQEQANFGGGRTPKRFRIRKSTLILN